MFSPIKSALIFVSCLALAGCGGGGSSSGSSVPLSPVSVAVPAALTVTTGDPLVFNGQASSTAGVITGMAWRIDPITLDANPVTAVGNADCKVAEKSSGGASWSCDLKLTPPTVVKSDYTYRLTLSAVDVKGNTASANTTLIVRQEASASYNPTAKTGADVTVSSGDKVSLSCAGSGGTPAAAGDPYSFAWLVKDAGGLDITLSALSGSTSSFIAPLVAKSTTVQLQCRVTDDAKRSGTAIQTVVVNPVVKPTVVAISTSGGTVNAGAIVSLDGSKSTRYDSYGKEVTGGTLYFFWKQRSGPDVTIANPFAATTSAAMPANIAVRTPFVFTLSVSNSPIDALGNSADPVKSVDVTYFVDPITMPPLTLVAFTPTQTVKAGANVLLKVEPATNVGSNVVYYSWKQLDSQPLVYLASATSANVGFVAPNVSADTQMKFRVYAGYQPIGENYAGVAYTDLVVNVQASGGSNSPVTLLSFTPIQSVNGGTNVTMKVDVPNSNGATIYYRWSKTVGPDVVIGGGSTNTAGFTAPVVTKDTTMVFRVEASTQPFSSAALGNSGTDIVVNVLAPNSSTASLPIMLVSYVPTQTVNSGANVILRVDAPSNTANQIYYKWKQINVVGQPLQLAAEETNNAGFIAPGVAAPTLLFFQVNASYQPITATNIGSAALQVIVQVKPAP